MNSDWFVLQVPRTPNPTQGFSLDYRVLGRQPTALGVLREFLPRRVWRDLAATTQNKIVVDLNSMLTPRNNRHANVPITPELLENIFITRLDMSLKPHHTIKAAYQNKPNWYPKHHHFTIANGNLAADIAQLTQFLSAEVRRVWRVNSVLVTDETIFKWRAHARRGCGSTSPENHIRMGSSRTECVDGHMLKGRSSLCYWTLSRATRSSTTPAHNRPF